MLVLSRKVGETLVIDGRIRVTIVSTQNGRVRVGIEAPRDVHIVRSELTDFTESDETIVPTAIQERARVLQPR